MKKYLKYFLVVIVFFTSFNAYATKMAPIPLEDLLSDSSIVTIINIKQASLSVNKYKIIHSGEERFYLNYVATIVDSIKGGDVGKTIEFSSREPLFVSREYLVFLNASKPGELFVAQAGFAAFEKTYIFFQTGINAGIKEGLRIPSSLIPLPKALATTPGVTKLNEYSAYVWVEWLPFKKWQIRYLSAPLPEK